MRNKDVMSTVEPRFNNGPRDWLNMRLLQIGNKFILSEFFSIYFTTSGAKYIVCYNQMLCYKEEQQSDVT